MRKIFLVLICTFFFCRMVEAQSGGDAYSFLKLSFAARDAALGGNAIAIRDNDATLAIVNPSLLHAASDKQIAISAVKYFADIKYGSALYAKDFKKAGTWFADLNYMDYGKITETDENGELLGGKQSAADYNFNIGCGVPMRFLSNAGLPVRFDSVFTMGFTAKMMYSKMADLTATALAADMAVSYYDSKHNISSSIVIRNAGHQLKPFYKSHPESLPFEIDAGIAHRLKLAPFRVSLTYQHLERYQIRPSDSLTSIATNSNGNPDLNTVNKSLGTADNFLRHLAAGVEFLPAKSFSFRIGYNLLRRKELLVDTRKTTVGISWGFGIKVSRFQLAYSRARYHLAGPSNTFTLITYLSEFAGKKKSDNLQTN